MPATSANLGPGFDCLGVALRLYNRVTVSRDPALPGAVRHGMVEVAAGAFFGRGGKPFAHAVRVSGDVPVSRGLGSSVTVRAGVVAGLNALAGEPLTMAECLDLVVDLEGHPDNAAPAFLGGFTVCTEESVVRVAVGPRLRFVALIPEIEIETEKARAVLPKTVGFADAVANGQRAAAVAAAFASGQYGLLRGAFADRLHQPYRKRLLPMLDAVVEAGEKAGALGGFLSGSGSTIMCVVDGGPALAARVGRAMRKAAGRTACAVRVLGADNDGLKVARRG